MKAIRLKTEHLTNPLGIDVRAPFLSWNCQGGIRQSAYQIAAKRNGEIFFDSGKIRDSKMYSCMGKEADSRDRITWKIRLWDEKDEPGPWSEEAFYEMGLLEPSLFTAKWINPELTCDPEVHKPASYLRTVFSGTAGRNARLYITSHGLYEAYLNGKRVGDFVLAPGSYNYDRHLAYQTYDVSGLIRDGENHVEVILGDGWYRSVSGVDGDRNLYGNDIALLFQLEIEGKPVCISDETWEASQNGPLRENDMQQGECADLNLEQITGYHSVKTEDFDKSNLICSNCLPIREMERFSGKIIRTPNGETVIDYGQNLAGYIEFTMKGHKGQRIELMHGETLDENGNFTQENFQERKRHKEGGTHQRVIVTLKEGENHYKSRFTIMGFRYAKVSGDVDLTDASFTAIAVYSAMEELASFTCGSAEVNQLVRNSIWSQKGNFCDVPTDCPTRERAAWTGDMGIFIDTGLTLMDCYPVVRKWLGECRLAQYEDGRVANIAPRNNNPSFFSGLLAGSVGWGDAVIIVPYAMYQRYQDKRILEENYEMMTRWYAYLERRAKKNPLNPMKRCRRNPYRRFTIETGIDYGEWCEPDVESTSAMRTPQNKVSTAYFAYSGRLLGEIAELLGKKEDAKKYRAMGENAAKAYRHIALEAGKLKTERQAELIRPIKFGLLEEDTIKGAAEDLDRLVRENGYHLNTGFLSTPDLCPILAEYGYVDTAYRVLLQEEKPGWLYAVKKGATTIWESWNGIDEKGVPSESLNHYSKGAISGWLIQGVCGIRVKNGSVEIRPIPHPSLKHAEASYQSPLGKIMSRWEYSENGTLRFDIEIPPNVEARILLPNGQTEKVCTGSYHYEI